MKKIRVALVQNIISPYRIALLNEVNKSNKIDLLVYFLNESARDRKWDSEIYKRKINFKYKLLSKINLKIPFTNLEYNINPTIYWHLKKEKFDVIIGAGWVDLANQTIPFLKSFFNFKYILWAGSTKDEPSIIRTIFRFLVKIIIKQSDAYITYGSKSKEYLISLGAKSNDVCVAYNSVNVSFFQQISELVKKKYLDRVKDIFNLPKNNFIILYSGQFIERKNLKFLISSVSKTRNKNITLILQGYGPLKNEYIKLAKKLNINFKILNYFENILMPIIYAVADIFVLPSKEEVWGLVVNEAMSCGLPVLVSNKAGCTSDLVINGFNGFSINPNNTSELSTIINTLTNDKEILKRMAKNNKKILSEKDISNSSKTIEKAIESVV